MSSYVILGGNGPFGVHLAIHLLEQPEVERVICIGRNPEKAEPFTLGVGRGDERYLYEQIHLTFEQDRLFELLDRERPKVVVNFAALAHGASWVKSHLFYETNVTALAKMVEGLAGRDWFEKFVQVGSSEIYGAVDGPVTEEAPLTPTSPYSISKMAGDLHLVSMHEVRGFPMNIIRPSNAYGPGQQLYRILPRAVLAAANGERVPLEGGGQARKSYIHARDLAESIQLIAERAEPGKIYNAGPPEPVAIRRLVELVAEEFDIPFDDFVEQRPGRPGEDAQYWLDSSLIKRDLGWEPRISLEEGVREMADWGKRYASQLREASTDYVLRA